MGTQNQQHMTGNRFFVPFKGKEYERGICGKKVFVVGASFYCDKNDCQFFSDCTNPDKKDSSSYDTSCPVYAKMGAELRNEPSYAIDENYPAYQRFAKMMRQFVGEEVEDVWQRMAFTNYVQFFVPTIYTYKDYLGKRDFEAFVESLVELQPDVVISWGMVTIEDVREGNPYVIDREKLPDSDWYICHLVVPGVDHPITLVCCFHPSSRDWNQDYGKFTKYLKQALMPKKQVI